MVPNLRPALRRIAVVILAVVCMAHVGSPDTFFTGQAGPYPVHVTVRLPGVIPGLAQITVRAIGPAPIDRVTVQAIQWNVGAEGAPQPDTAQRVPGDPQLYAADLWFMAPTSYRVHVTIDGREGTATAVVPVLALATAQREMPRGMGLILSALGVFLFVGLLTIVGAAVRESAVPPGIAPEPKRRRRARIAVGSAALFLMMVVSGGRVWWDAEASAYGEYVLYRPFASEASVTDSADAAGPRRVLTLTIKDRRWPPPPSNVLTRYNALMPDHGKLMHMFLIRDGSLDAFAHVHPVPRDATTAFDVPIPPLPAGRYRVYGDIVHESAYAQTLVANVDIGDPAQSDVSTTGDPDDSWFVSEAVPESPLATFRAQDGATITWDRGADPLIVSSERPLKFVVRDPGGAPASLEPYMGMTGHVVVARADGGVFAHLHPSGSVSMAALQKFTQPIDPHAMHQSTSVTGELSTLYAFPKPGSYRLWVQTKRAGRVLTAAFAAEVRAE